VRAAFLVYLTLIALGLAWGVVLGLLHH